MLFYDVTTLYFESTETDELRESGFSKDGKNANPQVVLGLLVSRGGYPLSYSLFNGSQYEGYTMIPIVDDFIQRFIFPFTLPKAKTTNLFFRIKISFI